MRISIIKKTKDKINLSIDKIKDIVIESVNCFGLTDGNEVEIIFVDPEFIKHLNKKHRNIDKPTDILSFPLNRYNLKHNILGSLIISQHITKEKNESLDQVIKHGILHLLGFDHEKNNKEWKEAALKIDCTL